MSNMKRKLSPVGSKRSIAVVIPVEIVKDLHWKAKQKVDVKRVSRGVKITDARSKRK